MIKKSLKKLLVVICIILIFASVLPTNADEWDERQAMLEGGAMPCMQVEIIYRPYYAVDGKELDISLQAYLYDRLKANGLEWWFTYALCQAYQESRYDIYAVNQTNFEDKGLFQYKEKYWGEISTIYGRPGADIFDPFAQIDIYVSQIAERVRTRGGDVWYMISDHYTGGCGYSQTYVNQVTQWINKIERTH